MIRKILKVLVIVSSKNLSFDHFHRKAVFMDHDLLLCPFDREEVSMDHVYLWRPL